MALILEIEYLSGVAFIAVGPDSNAPDWPPQPDRIFSALVATWAARGQIREEAEALEWLEDLPPPRILAAGAAPRTAPAVYVPPNDYETPKGELVNLKWYRDFLAKGITPPEKGGHKKLWLQAWDVMPDQRRRSGLKERNFPATRPEDPVVRLYWDETRLKDGVFAALQDLARDTAYVGHSASLTRCWFRRADEGLAPDRDEADQARRRVYGGRFSELRRSFEAGRRPSPGARVAPLPKAEPTRSNVFGARWLLLDHIGGDMPDLRACALVAKAIRNTMLSGYREIGRENDIPEVVSGHTADRTPSRDPHLAVIPLPFVGFPYADGHVMGFAVVPPAGCIIFDDQTFLRAMREVAKDEGEGRRVMSVCPQASQHAAPGFIVKLSPTFEPPDGRRSLDPALYIGRACAFATVTPIVLDRHLKERGEARDGEIAAQIAAACRNIGLPQPEQIVADKHSALEGAPSAYPSAASPAWMRWRLPASLASRQLTHAVIRFAAPVEGPVILGAGRFLGLGLCRPLDPRR